MIYLIEMTVAIDAAGTLSTLRATTAKFYATKPSDSPASTPYLPRVKTAGLFRRDMASPGRVYGATTVGYGLVTLTNNDGALDGWMDYGFDGRQIVIRAGEEGAAYSTFVTVLKGVMDQPEATMGEITIRLRDRLHELNKPMVTSTYLGNNSLPSGLEGIDDLKGKKKPRIIGNPLRMRPPCVNTSRLIYQVSDQAVNVISGVTDAGVVLTVGSVYTSQADMEANVPAAGAFRAWPGGGMFRLGSTPAGVIAAAVTQFASGSTDSQPAKLIEDVALAMGISAGDISATDVTALATAGPYENSGAVIEFDSEATALSIMDYFASSVGAWYGFDRLGVLRMQQLAAPTTAAAVYAFAAHEILTVERRASLEPGSGLPAWAVTAQYQRFNSPYTYGEIAASVAITDRIRRSTEWKVYRAEDASIKTKHPMAWEMQFDSAVTDLAYATAEADRRLALLKVERALYDLKVRLRFNMLSTIDLGSVVTVDLARFGMANKAFVVTGILHDPLKQLAELTLWG